MADTSRWHEVDRLLDEALDLPPEERAAFLDEACAGRDDVRREVETLLAAADAGRGPLDQPLEQAAGGLIGDASAAHRGPAEGLVGTRMGPYLLEACIGKGGMGEVYRARRADGAFEKEVALKVVRGSMITDDLLSRFRYERQILASLTHPNIAALLDGGFSEDGLPYLVMEYVDGTPITTYCDLHRLTTRQRLVLFRTVCRAVQFAHQNLVVHRDLKPSNILVTADGEVKLLDFGIAKLLAEDAPGAEPLTRTGQRLMTPEYASPEQVRGDVITTTSDVYALGVLLYELLTGHRPYRLQRRVQHEMLRVILEEEPSHLSAAVATTEERETGDGTVRITPEAVSAARSTTLDRLRRGLRGDLDNIAMMALRKEPERRYANVSDFSDDIGRHLRDLPVIARPDTWGYRTQKFVRRHTAGVAAAVVIVGLVATAFLLLTAQQAQTQREAERATEIKDFLVSLFEMADPDSARGRTLTAVALLDRGAERIETSLADQPDLRAEMQHVIGNLYYNLNQFTPARDILQKALQYRRQRYAFGHPVLAANLVDLSLTDRALHVPLAEEVLSMHAHLEEDHPAILVKALNIRGNGLTNDHRIEEADSVYRWAYALSERMPFDHPDRLDAVTNLAAHLSRTRQLEEAEAMTLELLSLQKTLFGDINSDVAVSLNNLGTIKMQQHEYAAAADYLRQAMDVKRVVYQGDSNSVALNMSNLGRVLHLAGQLEESEELLRTLNAFYDRGNWGSNFMPGFSQFHLSRVLWDAGKIEEAEHFFERAVDTHQRTLDAGHPWTGNVLITYGRFLLDQDRPEEAERLLRETVANREQANTPNAWGIAEARSLVGASLTAQGRYAEAEPLLRAAWDALQPAPDEVATPDEEIVAMARQHLYDLYTAWEKPQEAAAFAPTLVAEAAL